ncbi:hypothetical protein DPMN_004755 [Dreissena polymorpha]|uniref:Uncharacterized protein n=1 Tax=Dreissena polymorpha TaxID=45954 RepID=A0A9D4MP26_DREPO|nr:hypothetical protein DPMN_004746 [Dreissena polymorpha]KAH3880833.1 hypothetical protein DPMN_004755 [Dreissena polymorpha]
MTQHSGLINVLDSRTCGRILNHCYIVVTEVLFHFWCGIVLWKEAEIPGENPYLFGMVTTNQTHMLPGTGIEPGSPRWEASVPISSLAGQA